MNLRRPLDSRDLTVLFARLANLGAGPVVAVAVGVFFTAKVQGYYFSFASLLGAQTLFESGIGFVLIQLAAHEAAFLKIGMDGTLVGNEVSKSRLADIFHFGVRWYSTLAGVMIFGIGIGGWITFEGHHDAVDWRLPWVLLTLAGGFDFLIQPLLAVLEGCGKIVQVYRYRGLSVLVRSSILTACAWYGFNLYSSATAMVSGSLVGVLYLSRDSKLFWTLWRAPRASRLNWRRDVLPFQWRIAVSWIAGFFTTTLFTPIVLAQSGAVAAGQMGMTIAMFNGISMISFSIMQSRVPEMGGLAAARSWKSLDRLFSRRAVVSAALFLLGAGALVVMVWLAKSFGLDVANRVLDMPSMEVLGLGYFAAYVLALEATYLRCQKQEPFFILSLVTGSLVLMTSFILGHRFGPFGICVGYSTVYMMIALPLGTVILRRNRRRNRRADLEAGGVLEEVRS